MLVAAMITGLSDAAMVHLQYYWLMHCPFSIAIAAAITLELMAAPELHPFTIKTSLAMSFLDKVEVPGTH